jgi:hypothetical protein
MLRVVIKHVALALLCLPACRSDETADGGIDAKACSHEVIVKPSDKACASTDDCTVFLHQYDCTQSLIAYGVNKSALPALEDAEARFANCAICAAPAFNTVADDGTNGGPLSAGKRNIVPSVFCDGGRCTSTFAEAGIDAD